MFYENYEEKIVARYHVKLVGWPGKFESPSTINTVDKIRRLKDAWVTDSCKWVKLTSVERETFDAQWAIALDNGAGSTRERRTDFGGTHAKGGKGGKRPAQSDGDDGDDGEQAGGSRKRRRVNPESDIDSNDDDSGSELE